ncbi:protein-disulfide reductase DsbD family protein [Halioxenophilus aromaticivorans]|uniref:Cytochrome C biogenesis protein n=1 Tax=Halioxenophilus aromaticivorans TaxID=1306992 RepID=A0AAV3U0Q6_9ALTE
MTPNSITCRRLATLLLCCFALWGSAQLSAQSSLGLETNQAAGSLGITSQESFLRVEQAYQITITQQGDNQLALDWQIAPGYYLYRDNFAFKANGQTPSAEYEQGIVKYDEYFQEDLEIFHDSTRVILTDLPAPPYTLQVTSQGCADAGLCYPPYKQTFQVDGTNPIAEMADAPVNGGGNDGGNGASSGGTNGTNTEPPFSLGTWVASLIFAFIGGIILNLMPCVFPVLSIKALSLANSHHSQRALSQHGWAYTAGCVATFIAIAAVMLALRAGGAAIGWGFQLQSPVVIAGLLYLFFILGLSLSGVINLGSSFMGLGQGATQGHKLHHSFFTGALASVVASPCTAPMMGAALGFAITQPSAVALTVFAALGLGMATPFLLITLVPSASQLLPKPGAWMDTLKQALAFPMYAACVWLLWVLANQTSNNHLAMVGLGLVAIAFALWLLQHLPSRTLWRRTGQASAALVATVAVYIAASYKPATVDPLWESYSPQRLAELRRNEQATLVNLTAAWCITCLANEKVALSTDAVRQAMVEHNIQGLKGDWTNADPQITELLHQYGRSGVPLYLYFPASTSAEAVVLPQLLTPDIVLNTFTKHDKGEIAEISGF